MKKETIKIAAISDLHGSLPDTPPCDVLCICGDIVPLEVQSDDVKSIAWLCTKFYPWVQAQPCDKVIMIAGNHDFVFEHLRQDVRGNHRKASHVRKKLMMPEKLIYLDDSEYMYAGYRFYGSAWCPDLRVWAFYADHDQLVHNFSKIPANTDVLITHCPPRVDRFGMVQQSGFNYLNDYGCDELRKAIYEKKPKLSIFGHVHSGRHSREEFEGTMYANCSIKDENYIVTYDAQIFTINQNGAL